MTDRPVSVGVVGLKDQLPEAADKVKYFRDQCLGIGRELFGASFAVQQTAERAIAVRNLRQATVQQRIRYARPRLHLLRQR